MNVSICWPNSRCIRSAKRINPNPAVYILDQMYFFNATILLLKAYSLFKMWKFFLFLRLKDV